MFIILYFVRFIIFYFTGYFGLKQEYLFEFLTIVHIGEIYSNKLYNITVHN